jgi:hypothetical protein
VQKGRVQVFEVECPIENIQVYGDTVVVTGIVKMDAIVEGNQAQAA